MNFTRTLARSAASLRTAPISRCIPLLCQSPRAIHNTPSRLSSGDPYPLPLSPELEHQRAQPQGSVQSGESSALNEITEEDWPMPQPLDRTGEKTETMRARLVYQARKRGMLEGDLLLSTFARDNLAAMSHDELVQFDKMLDEPDWDIYYWSIEKRHPPERWAGSKLLEQLKKHARNEGKVVRVMPDLKDQV